MLRDPFRRGTAVFLLTLGGLAAPAFAQVHEHHATTTGEQKHTHTQADAQFMQGMIPHHAQALVMTALVPDRTERRDLLLLAERIEVAQGDEIRWMRRWLEDQGEDAPMIGGDHAHHDMGDHALMPGMLTADQLAQLAAATGPDFDRLFLEFMIQHHRGALVMVDALLASPGAAQLTEVYRFATDIDADQRADINRMRAMLEAPLLPASDQR